MRAKRQSGIEVDEASYQYSRADFATYIWTLISREWPMEDLRRIHIALQYWGGMLEPQPHLEQDTKGFFMPEIPDEPWIAPERFRAASILLDHFDEIQLEARSLVNGSILAPPYGLSDDAPSDSKPTSGRPKNWREWRLVSLNNKVDSRCELFPKTVAAIDKIMSQTPFLMSAKFMILGAGEETLWHTDFNNIFVNIWLNLIAPPDKCFLEVRGESRRPEPGSVFVFNHSYRHRAYNLGDRDRVVLCISHLHDNLSNVEQDVFASVTSAFRAYVESNTSDLLATTPYK